MSESSNANTGDKTAFLVGAGRSGTTLLYKLLGLHPKIAFISNYENRARWLPAGLMSHLLAGKIDAKLGAWFNQSSNAYFVNRPLRKKLFPTPVEGESIYQRCGVPLIPEADYRPSQRTIGCLQAVFESIRRGLDADVMLSKRTANNRRIPILSQIFPDARYVHLIRDGREVADSLSKVEWWDDHVLWWSGRTAAELERSGEPRISICARNWKLEMDELYRGLAAIPADRVLEIRYETLLSEPIHQLGSILDFLGLEMTAEYARAIESLNLKYRPGGWSKHWTSDQIDAVLREQQPLLNRLGYL